MDVVSKVKRNIGPAWRLWSCGRSCLDDSEVSEDVVLEGEGGNCPDDSEMKKEGGPDNSEVKNLRSHPDNFKVKIDVLQTTLQWRE